MYPAMSRQSILVGTPFSIRSFGGVDMLTCFLAFLTAFGLGFSVYLMWKATGSTLVTIEELRDTRERREKLWPFKSNDQFEKGR
jgi:hypothetical protein